MLVQGRHGCLGHFEGIFEKCWGRIGGQGLFLLVSSSPSSQTDGIS